MVVLTVLALATLAFLGWLLALYLLRETPVDRVRWLDGDGEQLAAGAPLFVEAVRLLTSTPIAPGNRVAVLANGDETFDRLWHDLARARAVITWQVFWFKPGRLAERALEVLAERAGAGVRVLCLLDAWGSRGLGDAYLARLRAAGVEVATFRPPRWRDLYKVQQRMHVRSVVVDGAVGYTGGFGIDDRWAGDGRRPGQWRDTNVRVAGPIVDRLQAAFVTNWAEATGEILLGRTVFSLGDAVEGDGQAAGVLRGVPSLGSTVTERLFLLSILGARERLWVTNAYFVPDAAMRRLLTDAAGRGVDVRVLTPGRNTDRKSAWLAARSHYEALLRGGVRLYEYRPTMVHAKTFVADGRWSCVGSVNFDNRSMKLNTELAVVTPDPAAAAALERLFEADLAHADEVRLDEVRARGRRQRVAEHLARLVAPLL